MKKTNLKSFRLLSKIKKITTNIKIDYSFFVALIIAIFLKEIKLYLCSVIFVILHELSHFFVAKRLGYMAKKIHISFFGASLEGLDDFTLSDEINVIIAGPLFNLIIIVLCYLSFWFYPETYNYLYEILLSNIALFIFNFLPIYPLDLGRIILALFTRNNTREKALKKTKFISFIFIILMFVGFIISMFYRLNFSLGLVCINLMSLLLSSSEGTSFKRELFIFHKAKLLKKGLVEKNVYVKLNTPLYSLFKFIDDYHYFNFIFIDENFDIRNTLSEVEFYHKTGFL